METVTPQATKALNWIWNLEGTVEEVEAQIAKALEEEAVKLTGILAGQEAEVAKAMCN